MENNIHVLPTDKTSRLVYNSTTKKLDLYSGNVHSSQCKNIYITSDEQLEYEDFFIDVINRIYRCNTLNPKRNDNYKKIILTTDQYLIKEGVQAIDDEFLEWFVKNPSCEEVEVEKLLVGKDIPKINFTYKIIIPKEEPMSYEDFRKNAPNDLIIKFDTDCLKSSEDGNSDNYFYANCKFWENKLKEEPKQETLREKLESLVVQWHQQQLQYEALAEKHKENEHNFKKFTYKAMATRDCWKELLTLLNSHKDEK